MTKPSESEVIQSIKELCSQAGYIHALAKVVQDSVILKIDAQVGITGSDLTKASQSEWLNKNEINTLLGFWVQTARDDTLINEKSINEYAHQTKDLMQNLHDCMTSAVVAKFDITKIQDEGFNPLLTNEPE